MILRVRSHLGTIRCIVEDSEQVITLRERIISQWPDLRWAPASTWHVRSKDERDLFQSSRALQTFAAAGFRHGDLVHLEMERAREVAQKPVQAPAACEVEWTSEPLGPSIRSHAGIYAFIRDRLIGGR